MSIPADFRRVLESQDPEWTEGLNPRMYLLYGEHLKQELHVYTVAEFGKLVDQINAMPKGEIWKAATFNATVAEDMTSWLDEMPDDFDPLSMLDAG